MQSPFHEHRAALVLTITLVFVFITLAGCSSINAPSLPTARAEKPTVPPGGILLQGAGATFPSVLYQKWFATYQQQHPETVVAYEAVGSGEGIRRFVGQNVKDADKVDFGASDAAMQDEQMARVPGGVILLPVTAGTVVLAYNIPGVGGELKLSRQAYAGIFLGQIKSWNDPVITRSNPGLKLPKLTIATVVRQDGSGTTFAFTKHLDSVSTAWRSQFGPATLVNWPGNAMRASGNEGVAARIKQSIGAIGYVSYEFALKAGLSIAQLENREGKFVAPSEKSGMAAIAQAELPDNLRVYVPDPTGPGSYPIVTLTWILLYRNYADERRALALHQMLRWCLTDGQKYAPELHYVPLPPNVVARSLVALNDIELQKQ
jgi:phosphate transport system substrate-binding protein